MADQTQTQLSGIFLPEYQEKYLKDLLANVTDISKTSPLGDVAAPDVMQFTPNQLEAIRLGRAGQLRHLVFKSRHALVCQITAHVYDARSSPTFSS